MRNERSKLSRESAIRESAFCFAGFAATRYRQAVTKLTPVYPGNRIELPSEWAAEMGLDQFAALEKTKEGILVHSCSASSWDDVFAQKLRIGSAAERPEAIEVAGDSVIL
jgi:hypothetical protein